MQDVDELVSGTEISIAMPASANVCAVSFTIVAPIVALAEVIVNFDECLDVKCDAPLVDTHQLKGIMVALVC